MKGPSKVSKIPLNKGVKEGQHVSMNSDRSILMTANASQYFIYFKLNYFRSLLTAMDRPDDTALPHVEE